MAQIRLAAVIVAGRRWWGGIFFYIYEGQKIKGVWNEKDIILEI